MKALYFTLFSLVALSSFAQRTNDQKLEDSVFAWKSFTPITASKYPRSFTQAQLKLPGLFKDWIQKSYIPIGAIDNTFAIAEPNKKDEVTPHAIGINAEIWNTMWDKAGKKVVRLPHSANPIYLLTNYIIDAEPVAMLTKTDKPVFIRRSPDAAKTFAGWQYGETRIKEFNLHNDPKFSNYQLQYYGCEGDMCQPRVAIYLSPNNRLPIRQLTQGEVLELIEKAIPSETTKAKNKLKSTYGHRPQSLQEEYKRFDETVLPKWKANLENLKKQYSSSLHTPAEIGNINGVEMINIFNGDDIFKKSSSRMFSIYTYEDDVMQKSKGDKPLWICISWMPANLSNNFSQRELHRSMMEHFNFDYVYNYFFSPQKNNNASYSILNPQAQKDNIANLKKEKNRINTSTAKLPAGVHYLDDFLANTIGQKPAGWYFSNIGEPCLVATPDGLTGKWVDIRTQKFIPTNCKRPLPKDFQFEFDVACSDFTSNTGGALLLNINNKVLTANGDETDSSTPINIDFTIKAGNAKWTTNPTGGSSIKATYKGMPGTIRYAGVDKPNLDFTNKKNSVHILITKKGNQVKGYIDGKEIVVQDKYGNTIPGYNELPQGAQLNSFYFRNTTNGNENRVYISNVKITSL